VGESLLFNAFFHGSTIIDTEHDFGDFLFLDITLHVCKACNSIHADVISCRSVMSFQKAVELSLVDVLVQVPIALKFLLETGFALLLNFLQETH